MDEAPAIYVERRKSSVKSSKSEKDEDDNQSSGDHTISSGSCNGDGSEGDWVERRDPGSGKVFYFNLDTGVSTYEVPKMVLSGEWEVMKDPVSDRIFYFHKKSGRSQWEKPLDGFVTPGQSAKHNGEGTDGEEEEAKSAKKGDGSGDYETPQVVGNSVWTEVWDDGLQRRYWFNQLTGESRWVRPTAGSAEDDEDGDGDGDEGVVIRQKRPAQEYDNGDWRVMKDSVTGRVFYYNAKTGNSQWEKPAHFIDARLPRKSSAGEKWEKLRDPQTGRVFFFNKEEGITQWERPEGAIIENEEEEKSPNTADDEKGKDEWEEIFDPGSNKVFYFNKSMGTSQWNPPNGFPGSSSSTSLENLNQLETDQKQPDREPTMAPTLPPPSIDDEMNDKDVDIEPEDEKQAVNLPPPPLATSTAHPPLAVDSDWKEQFDEKLGRVYYYNTKTKESQWINPQESKVNIGDWCELTDAKTERKYYYNKKTGESKWRLDSTTSSSSSSAAPKAPDDPNEDKKPPFEEISVNPSVVEKGQNMLEMSSSGRPDRTNSAPNGHEQSIDGNDSRRHSITGQVYGEQGSTVTKEHLKSARGDRVFTEPLIPDDVAGKDEEQLRRNSVAGNSYGSMKPPKTKHDLPPSSRGDRVYTEANIPPEGEYVEDDMEHARRHSIESKSYGVAQHSTRRKEDLRSSVRGDRLNTEPDLAVPSDYHSEETGRRHSVTNKAYGQSNHPTMRKDDLPPNTRGDRLYTQPHVFYPTNEEEAIRRHSVTNKAYEVSGQPTIRKSDLPQGTRGDRLYTQPDAFSPPGVESDWEQPRRHSIENRAYETMGQPTMRKDNMPPNTRGDRLYTQPHVFHAVETHEEPRRHSVINKAYEMSASSPIRVEDLPPGSRGDRVNTQPHLLAAQPLRDGNNDEDAGRRHSVTTKSYEVNDGGSRREDLSRSSRGDRLHTQPELHMSEKDRFEKDFVRRHSAAVAKSLSPNSHQSSRSHSSSSISGEERRSRYASGDTDFSMDHSQSMLAPIQEKADDDQPGSASWDYFERYAAEDQPKESPLMNFAPFAETPKKPEGGGEDVNHGSLDSVRRMSFDFKQDVSTPNSTGSFIMQPPDHPPPPFKQAEEDNFYRGQQHQSAIDIPEEFRPDRVFSSMMMDKKAAPPPPPGPISAAKSSAATSVRSITYSPLTKADSANKSSHLKIPPGKVLYSGYLEKRARHGRQVWQRRWFVLDSAHLRYYESEKSARVSGNSDDDHFDIPKKAHPLATIDLNHIKEVEIDEGTGFVLKGRGPMGVLCKLRAPSSEERSSWMFHLNRAIPQVVERQAASMARATRDFRSDEEGTLSFRKGDRIRILRKMDSIWTGELHGKIGTFRADHVTYDDEDDETDDDVDVGNHPQYDHRNATSPPSSRSSPTPSSPRGNNKSKNNEEDGFLHSFTDVERRMENRKQRERLEQLLNGLGVEPMKRLETYPTDSVLQSQRKQLREMNVRNHKLKAEVRGLEWALRNRLDKSSFGSVHTGEEQSPHAFTLVAYSRLLGVLQREPYLLVQVAASLHGEAQFVMASTLANSLFDQYSVQETMFQDILLAAIEMLWDQGLPPFDLLRRQRQSGDLPRSFMMNNEAEQQPLLPALLIAFVERDECQNYLSKIITSFQQEFMDLLLSVGDTGVKTFELACLVLDAVASDAGLDLLPSSICTVGALLHDVGGQQTLYRFLFEVLLVPALFDPSLKPKDDDLRDPLINRRVAVRLSRLAEFLCVEIPRMQENLAAVPVGSSHRVLIRLVDKIQRKVINEGGKDYANNSSFNSGDGDGDSLRKPRELCDLVVVSCFELYMLHLAVATYVKRHVTRGIASEIISVLQELGQPRPLPSLSSKNPYLVLRLSNGGLNSTAGIGHEEDEDHAPGLDATTMKLLIRARSKIDSLYESWNPVKDGELVKQIEDCIGDARLSLSEQKRLKHGYELAQRYHSDLVLQKERLLHRVGPNSPRELGRIPKSPTSKGLIASVPPPNLLSPKHGGANTYNAFLRSTHPTTTINNIDDEEDTIVDYDSDEQNRSMYSSFGQSRVESVGTTDEDENEDDDEKGNRHVQDDSNPLATLLATVFSPLKIQTKQSH